MDLFSNLITIHKKDGTVIEDVRSSVQKHILIKDKAVPIEEGDLITQKLPSGLEKRMLAVNVQVYDTGSILDHIEVEYVNA